MIAFTRAHHEELLHALRVCRDAGVAVDVVPRLFEFLDGARTVDQIGGMPLLSIAAPTFSAPSRVSKRTLDLVGAGLALIVLSPLLLAIAIAIKLDSRGPVLFTQPRSGRGGRFFKLYKFRSMHNEATVEVRDDGAIVKSRDDDRITRVGRVHPPPLARRGAAADQRPQGRHEPRRPAPARDGRGPDADRVLAGAPRRPAPRPDRARGRSPGARTSPSRR